MRHFSLSDNKGFTLIEIALVLFIAGILISMGVELMPMLVRQHAYTNATSKVQEAKTALIGYAMANGRLPWAAAAVNGVATNNRRRGYLPYATLGMQGIDPYNNPNPIYYAVEPTLANIPGGRDLKGQLDYLNSHAAAPVLHCNANPGGSPAGTTNDAFVVLSVGQNKAVNAPNNIAAGSNATFEAPGSPQTATYDDILAEEALTVLRGVLP